MRSAARIGVVLCGLAGLAAAAESIYRCGSGQYQSAPCPGGVQIDAADARTAEQQHQAQTAAQRDAALAAGMTAQRLERERRSTRARAATLGAAASAPAPPASASKTRRTPPKHRPPPVDPRMSAPMQAPAASAARR